MKNTQTVHLLLWLERCFLLKLWRHDLGVVRHQSLPWRGIRARCCLVHRVWLENRHVDTLLYKVRELNDFANDWIFHLDSSTWYSQIISSIQSTWWKNYPELAEYFSIFAICSRFSLIRPRKLFFIPPHLFRLTQSMGSSYFWIFWFLILTKFCKNF